MKFTKMQGLGNDYIYINAFEEQADDLPALARRMSDRHFGVGGDGLVLIAPSDTADFRMIMYNADGSRGAMCADEQKKVLSVRPGITDYASIEYVDENMILGEASDPDRAYIEQIMPDKIRYNMKYICNPSVKEYFKIIFQTFWSIIR